MSPGDEIRYINRLKKQGKKLTPYQQWVLGGCRGPHPSRRVKLDKHGRAQRVMFCPGTRLSQKHYVEVLNLIDENARLKQDLRTARKLMANILRLCNKLSIETDLLAESLDA